MYINLITSLFSDNNILSLYYKYGPNCKSEKKIKSTGSWSSPTYKYDAFNIKSCVGCCYSIVGTEYRILEEEISQNSTFKK